MESTVRDSFVGQLLRAITKGKVFKYAEEKPGFEVPEKYKIKSNEKSRSTRGFNDNNRNDESRSENGNPDLERRASDETAVGDNENENENGQQSGDQNKEKKGKNDDVVIVDWYSKDDPENPLNWSIYKKCFVTVQIMLLTSSVYMGSSIYTPGVQDAMRYFGLGQVTVTLGLSLFVAGYAIGPLFLSPITEIPHIGRTIPYIATLFLFMILQVPTALVTNFAGFAILRFLAGFVGSPPLATGGASIQDIYRPHKVPYALGLWGLSAGAAPAIAPVISAFAVEAKGWRWAFWELLWLSAGTLIILCFFLPETSAKTILLRRAQRLRKLTGNDKLHSQSELESKEMTPGAIVSMTLVRPITMTFTEPILLSINLYIGLIYAVLYSYFESFPIVYAEGYGFSLGVSVLPFLSLLVGAIISYSIYAIWARLYFEPKYFKHEGKLRPETRLPMAMAGAFCFPICLFWFAWTANRTSWVSPMIASGFFGLGTTWMFMPFLSYLGAAYPEYAASVLASNDFVRSMFGAGMPLAAVPLFKNLGIDWGNTLLGCLTVLFIPIPFILYKAGPWLRERSPKALHDNHIEDGEPDHHVVGREP